MSVKIDETSSNVSELKTHIMSLETRLQTSEKSNKLRDKLILEKSDLEKLANAVDDENL